MCCYLASSATFLAIGTLAVQIGMSMYGISAFMDRAGCTDLVGWVASDRINTIIGSYDKWEFPSNRPNNSFLLLIVFSSKSTEVSLQYYTYTYIDTQICE